MSRSRTALALLLATAGLGLGASTASAATSGPITDDATGVTKATWNYDRDSNKLCVTTLTGARTHAEVTLTGPPTILSPNSYTYTTGDAGRVTDVGGDASPSCIRAKARWDGVLLNARGDWWGSGYGHGSMPVAVFYG